MKNILAMALLALSGAVYAHGSSHPPSEVADTPTSAMRPCFINVDGFRFNANLLTAVYVGSISVDTSTSTWSNPKWEKRPAVYFEFGKAYHSIQTPNPDAMIAKFLDDAKKTCR